MKMPLCLILIAASLFAQSNILTVTGGNVRENHSTNSPAFTTIGACQIAYSAVWGDYAEVKIPDRNITGYIYVECLDMSKSVIGGLGANIHSSPDGRKDTIIGTVAAGRKFIFIRYFPTWYYITSPVGWVSAVMVKK